MKKMVAGVAKFPGKNESSIGGTVRREKEFCAGFAVAPRAANASHQAGIVAHHVAPGRAGAAQCHALRERDAAFT